MQFENGRLKYPVDSQGNRLVDFSHCGYQGYNVEIPVVAARVAVVPTGNDDTARLQKAIDYVSSLPRNKLGFRGAVLLAPGRFDVKGQLVMRADGVVLRGSGAGAGGTTVVATGTDRRALILVDQATRSTGGNDPNARKRTITDDWVPANAGIVHLDNVDGLSIGQLVQIHHPSTSAWIEQLGIDRLGWREGTRDIRWVRTIQSIHGLQVELDAPLTLAIDSQFSRASLTPLNDMSRTSNVGIEDLALESSFQANQWRDESHSWYAVNMPSVRDAWVCRVAFKHFAGGAVMLGEQASRVTVADCVSRDPVSELGGYRRNTFFTLGQQCLFLRCWSEQGIHDFCAGHCAAGPNAFVACYAKNTLGDSGPRESCAVAVLYDNTRIDGHDLNLMNRWNSPTKCGWTAINCLLWQCQAANVRCEQPPIGGNWAVGIWANPLGDGFFSGLSDFVKPISLFQQQLLERVGPELAASAGPFLLRPVGATNPSLDQAEAFTLASRAPGRQLIEQIQSNWKQSRTATKSIPDVDSVTLDTTNRIATTSKNRFSIKNGWLVANGELAVGAHYTPSWWRGELPSERAAQMGRAITRFAPGRLGVGLTDDLDVFAAELRERGYVGYDHHYGLWYDRRRDDHLMVKRKNGEVIPPFYEQPFARAGVGTAWDGLSKYDLTKFNPWYFSRLSRFAELGERDGFAMFHHHYFQHNILEAGAHWADSPWRPANNVNQTGLPEPPPYVGDKRIFLDASFYDTSNAELRSLHENYIRKCLENGAGYSNVIHLISAEFSGPLSFVQFWLDCIERWERDTGQAAMIGLSCPKDVQDAILQDERRSRQVDLIDIRYWTYTEDGQLYAPPGGKHVSPRQHLRRLKPKSTSFSSIVRTVSEYRNRYPDKAVTYHADIYCRAKRDAWAILMGGGSFANIKRLSPDLAAAVLNMLPASEESRKPGDVCLADGKGSLLLYRSTAGIDTVKIPAANCEWAVIDLASGNVRADFVDVVNRRIHCDGPCLLWVRPKTE